MPQILLDRDPDPAASSSTVSAESGLYTCESWVRSCNLSSVMPPGRATTARVRALVDFLVETFGPEPAWDPCWMAGDR